MGAEFILYPQQSTVNFGAQRVSGTLVQFYDLSESPFDLISPSFIILYRAALYVFFPDFPICGCLPPFLTPAEILEMEGEKKNQTTEFTYFKVMFTILGSELREQSRI